MFSGVKAHYKETSLGNFITCMESIYLQNMLHLISIFTFGVWALFFDFHIVNAIKYYLKKIFKNKFKE
jgi:hypothetical protein